MEKIDFKNLPDKTTPINAANLNKMQDNTEKAIDKALEGYTPSGGGSGGDTLPIGAILPFSSDTIPNGWLLCDGSVIEQEDYPELFEVLAGNYGIISREEIRLPDLRGKVTVGKDSTDADFDTLGNTGGEKTHTLTVNEMPKHSHNFQFDQTEGSNITAVKVGTNNTYGKATSETGGDQPHNNLQPYIVTNYIIKAKMTIVTNGEVIQQNGIPSTDNVYSAKAIDNKLKTNITTGQEVATNEYIDGKRVYKRNISAIGENSSGTTLTLSNINFDFSEIWIDESNSFISSESETLSINWYFAPEDYCRLWIGKNTKIIRYRTGGNLSGRTFNIMLKYTKNT